MSSTKRLVLTAIVCGAVVYLMLGQHGLVSVRAQTSSVTVQFDPNSYTVNESAGTVTLDVTLSDIAGAVVTVNYATSDGTAFAGTDYTAASGELTFPVGSTLQQVTIPIIDNGSYTNLEVYFTVTLSAPSPNATLLLPPTCVVNILDDDPAPTCDIEINGVAKADKNNPGGYVAVNANNDNGSKLTYADGVTVVPAGSFGIPQMRDFAPKNVKLAAADPDLLQITLATAGLKAGGPENIVLSVSVVKGGRAQIQIWDTGTKNNQITPPTNWKIATMPAFVYVEGLLEGAALMEITLQLQILNKLQVVDTKTCVLTVTPVLTNLVVVAGKGAVPGIADDRVLKSWIIDSEPRPKVGEAFTSSEAAQWNNVRGDLRFIQTGTYANNLTGGVGADLGPRTWDFAKPNAGKTLVDSTKGPVPFYTANEKRNVAANVATSSVTDSPALMLDRINDVLPAVGKTTNVDVTYNYMIYATVAYKDNSIYCIGQQSWNVRFAGAVTQPKAGDYAYAPAKGNADNGSGAFAASVRNNANPVATGPATLNASTPAWR